MVKKLVTNDVDVLVVVDNSASTADKQAQLMSNVPALIQAFDAFPTGRPNLHIGVASTSVSIGNSNFGANCANGDDGLMQNTARVGGCTAPTGRFLIDIANGAGSGAPVCGVNRTCDYPASETLAQAVVCIAALGSTGCGFEAQLEGMKRALDGSRPENAGFVRPTSALAILILTDEDDCSVADPAIFGLDLGSTQVNNSDFRCQPLYAYSCGQAISTSAGGTYTGCGVLTGSYLADPGSYYQFLTTLKDPSALVVETISGDSASTIMTGMISSPFSQALALLPQCTATVNGNFAIARPGIRLAAFRTAFGVHGVFDTACASNYSSALVDFASTIALATGPCIEGNLATADTDAANPGLQLACTVTGGGIALPACKMIDATNPDTSGPQPCYWLEAGSSSCAATQTHVAVHASGSPALPIALSCLATS